MIYSEQFKMTLEDIDNNYSLSNRGILRIFENIATYHSDSAGCGPVNIMERGVSWVLTDWQIKSIRRPIYGTTLTVNTWARYMKSFYSYRDYEICDDSGNLCAIGTSKWTLVDIKAGRLTRIPDYITEKYRLEDKCVFSEDEMKKIRPLQEYSQQATYTVSRRDIDLNRHLHNLNYLDIACEALPEDIFNQGDFDNIKITFRKEIKYGETVQCKYAAQDDCHFIGLYASEDDLRALIKMS